MPQPTALNAVSQQVLHEAGTCLQNLVLHLPVLGISVATPWQHVYTPHQLP